LPLALFEALNWLDSFDQFMRKGPQDRGAGVPATRDAVEQELRDEGVQFANGCAEQALRWRPADQDG
jgi:hypothetical protein